MSGAELDPAALVALRHVAGRDRGRGPVTALPGGQVTRQRGPGLETMEIRPFADGDDPRHVDRNATARAGRPQVRVFHAEKDRATLLIADFRPSMLWGTRRVFRSVAAAERLALVGWRAAEAGARVGMVAVTAAGLFHSAPRPRDRGMIGAIGEMARAHEAALAAAEAPEPPLADALIAAARLAPKGAEATLATALDAPGDGFETAILLLARRAALRIERIADAFELSPPPGRYRVRTPDGAVRFAAASAATAGGAGTADDAEAVLAHLHIPVLWRDSSGAPDADGDRGMTA